jgi:hypothetical protein
MVEHLSLASALAAAHAPMLVDDPLQVITDPAGWVASWLWPALFGKDATAQPTWAADLFARVFFFTGLDPSACSGGTGGNCSSFNIWSALQTTGYLVLAMALMLRMVRQVWGGGGGLAKGLVWTIIVRAALGVAAINLSYVALSGLMHSSIVIAGVLFDNIMAITTGGAQGEEGLRQALAGILSFGNFPIPLILETFVLLYLMALLIASRIAIIFAIAVAPLVVPIWAYNGSVTLLSWWLRLVGQGLLVPIVMGALLPVALIVIQAANGVQIGIVAPLFGTITAIVAFWFVGHAIRQLIGHLFPEHRGFVAGASTAQGRYRWVRGVIGR